MNRDVVRPSRFYPLCVCPHRDVYITGPLLRDDEMIDVKRPIKLSPVTQGRLCQWVDVTDRPVGDNRSHSWGPALRPPRGASGALTNSKVFVLRHGTTSPTTLLFEEPDLANFLRAMALDPGARRRKCCIPEFLTTRSPWIVLGVRP